MSHLLKMFDHTGVKYVRQYTSCVFFALHYSMSKPSISTVPSLLTQGKGRGTCGSYVHRGYTRLYKFIRIVSWERSWLSNTHFMWPCVPVEINMVVTGDNLHNSHKLQAGVLLFFFSHLMPPWCGLCDPTLFAAPLAWTTWYHLTQK